MVTNLFKCLALCAVWFGAIFAAAAVLGLMHPFWFIITLGPGLLYLTGKRQRLVPRVRGM
jgi:hypothetical protein